MATPPSWREALQEAGQEVGIESLAELTLESMKHALPVLRDDPDLLQTARSSSAANIALVIELIARRETLAGPGVTAPGHGLRARARAPQRAGGRPGAGLPRGRDRAVAVGGRGGARPGCPRRDLADAAGGGVGGGVRDRRRLQHAGHRALRAGARAVDAQRRRGAQRHGAGAARRRADGPGSRPAAGCATSCASATPRSSCGAAPTGRCPRPPRRASAARGRCWSRWART